MRAAAAAMFLLIASCTSVSPFPQNQSPVIVIGSDLPLSGPDGVSVQPLRAAIELAIADHGTLHGFSLRYEPLDDTLGGLWNTLKGEQNAKILATDPRVLGMVGPYNSPVARFEIPVTNAAGLVMISPSNTADCLTASTSCASRPSDTNNYFRLVGTDSGQARAAAAFALGTLHVKRLAVLSDGSGFGNFLTEVFKSELAAGGGTVVYTATYNSTQDEYRPLLRDASSAGAQAVFAGGLYDGACKIRSQMAGIFATGTYMIANDQVTDAACISDAGSSADDHLLALVSSSQPPPTSEVFKEFRAHGISPVTYTFEAYDAAAILIDAIDRAIKSDGGGLPTRREVRDAVSATHDFVGSSGTFTFLPSGDPTQPSVSVYRVQNRAWSFWQKVVY